MTVSADPTKKDGTLTQKQLAVMTLIGDGLAAKQIAPKLGISERRTRYIIDRLCDIASVDKKYDKRVQLARWWMQREAA